MLPDDVEYYVNGAVGLEVRTFGDHTSYWIKGGIGFLEFKEEEFKNLIDLLKAYDEEELRPNNESEE